MTGSQRGRGAKNGDVKPNWLVQLEAFQQACHDRLVAGDHVVTLFAPESVDALLGEIQQDLEDQANRNYIAWLRIQALRDIARPGDEWLWPQDREVEE